MIDLKILRRAILVGVTLQLILVVGSHFQPQLRGIILFAFMLIAGLAGLFYARDLAGGYGPGMLGGATAGASAALFAVGLSSLLGDRPDLYLPYGVMIGTLTGAVGGVFGQMDAWLRGLLLSLRR